MERLNWLLLRPVRLVAAVAMLVALPILVLGEISANDTRERLRREERATVELAAERAAALINDRLLVIRDTIQAFAAEPDLRRATTANDQAGVRSYVSRLRAVVGSDAAAAFLVNDELKFLATSPDNLTVEDDRLKSLWDFALPRAFRGASTVVEFAVLVVFPQRSSPPSSRASSSNRGRVGVVRSSSSCGPTALADGSHRSSARSTTSTSRT